MPSPDNPNGKCAYLMNIYTRPAYRGCGIGKKVVEWLICEAQKRNIAKIYLEASEAGRPLYEKLGFVNMHGYMKLENDQDE
jgi:GNAT superfamily N-acetyltransferase